MNQQNQLKSFLARITTALVFILIACPSEVRADDSGYCGDSNVNGGKDVIWNLTDEDNDGTKETLTITGTGAIMDYNSAVGGMPWESEKDNIKTVVIEEGVTSIGYDAFMNCQSLLSVTIPSSVTSIGDDAFWFCTGLLSVTIPSSVTSIGKEAFWSCSSLTSVTIPESVTSIGDKAFEACLKLQDVHVLRDNSTSITTLGEKVFYKTHADLVIYIPHVDYFKDDNWSTYANKMLYQNGAISINKDNNGMHATLDDNYTGTADINITSDIEVADVTLNREFTADVYSTIVLPFGVSMSNLTGIESIAQFSGVEKDDKDVWTASMTELWNDESTSPVTLSAYTPYVVKMKDGALSVTGNVTLKETVAPETTVGDWTFVGTLAPTALPIEGEHDYGFAGGSNADNSVSVGDFVHLVSGASAKPFRAYLKYTGTDTNWTRTRSSETIPSRIQVRILKLNGQTTAIGSLNTSTYEINSDEWYSIDGRRLSGKPSSKGIYINNGRKVVVQ